MMERFSVKAVSEERFSVKADHTSEASRERSWKNFMDYKAFVML